MRDRKRLYLVVLALAALPVLPITRAMADTAVKANNDTGDTDAQSGDAHASNSETAQVGPQGGGGSEQVGDSDVSSAQATNVQEGDNAFTAEQAANSQSGDAVGGQVIGAVVPNGNLDVDATNLSENVDLLSGDASSENGVAAFVGLSNATETTLASDVSNGTATNVQEGDNRADATQMTAAATGDAVGGQIFGAVTGGTTDVVIANTSTDTDAASGDASESNGSDMLSGLSAAGSIVEV